MKLNKCICSLILMLCLVLCAGIAMAVDVSDSTALISALSAGGTVVMQNDITAAGPINTTTNTTLDLGGHKLTLTAGNNRFEGDVVIQNGIIDITNLPNHSEGIFVVGILGTSTTLTLQDVFLTGSNYYSNSGVFHVYYNDTLNFIRSKVQLSNDLSDNCVIRLAVKKAKLNIIDSEFILDNARRGIITQDVNNSVKITNSSISMSNMKHGINVSCPIEIINSDINLSNLTGHGIGMYYNNGTYPADASLKISGNSKVEVSNCKEGDIAYEGSLPVASDIAVASSSSLSFRTVSEDQTNQKVRILKQSEVAEWIGKQNVPQTEVYFDAAGNVVIGKQPVRYSAPKTGDNSQIMLWASLMLVSVLGMTAAARKRVTER